MSKIYVAQRTRSFNRLTNGPTWGINSASLALSNMAQRGRVDARTIRTELAQHPRLAIRLDKAGVDFLSLEQGTGADDIAAAFRFALYSGKKTQKLARLGFARDEEAVPFPISLSQLHWAVPGSASLEYLGGREGVTDLEQDLGIERSLASRVIDRLRLAYVIPTLICAGLSTLLFVTQGWVTDSFVLDKGLTDVANEDGVVGGGVGVAVGEAIGVALGTGVELGTAVGAGVSAGVGGTAPGAWHIRHVASARPEWSPGKAIASVAPWHCVQASCPSMLCGVSGAGPWASAMPVNMAPAMATDTRSSPPMATARRLKRGEFLPRSSGDSTSPPLGPNPVLTMWSAA